MSVNETQTQGDRRGVLTGSEPASGQSERPMFRPVFAASVAAGAAVVGALSIPSDKDTFKRHVKDTFLPTTRPGMPFPRPSSLPFGDFCLLLMIFFCDAMSHPTGSALWHHGIARPKELFIWMRLITFPLQRGHLVLLSTAAEKDLELVQAQVVFR
jgi:hypothetical protein